jgi:predicted nuclease of predicted toxin-antitoxin system
MKLLTNENFPLKSVLFLREKGFDVKHIGTDFPGIKDSEVVNLAVKESRIIITFDKDYGTLIFKKGYRPKCGVIFFKWTKFNPEAPGKVIDRLFTDKKLEFENALTVIDDKNIRQKKYS